MTNKLKTTTLLLGLISGGCAVAASPESPRIVVGIVVDQLRTDYLEQLRPYFGDRGFNRLISQGVYLPDVDFRNAVGDAPSGAAVVYTGAWPAVNGIASAENVAPALPASKPSPETLRVSTLADEFFITHGNLSKIYSLSGNLQEAMIAAGHAGNSAIWFDESAGRWNSPAYYGALPPVIGNKNRTSPLASRISSASWRPVHPATHYPDGRTWRDGDFSYTFSGGTRDAYTRFKASAPFNAEVTDAAIDLLHSMQAGGPGMLGVAYSVAPIRFDYDGDNRPELVDSYVRLDSELGRLLDSIDREYGPGNAVVFLSSTGYAAEPEIPEGDARIPSGEITLRQAESLLNSYLSASYGNGDYVRLIKRGKLFLDQKEASAKGLDIRQMRKEVKDFLLRMGGVSEAYTVDEVLHSDHPKAREMALGIDPKDAPDVFIFFQPGWTVVDDGSYPPTTEKIRLAAPPTPAFILSTEFEPQTISYPVDATALAPTIASAIHIRAPNAAASKPITLAKASK